MGPQPGGGCPWGPVLQGYLSQPQPGFLHILLSVGDVLALPSPAEGFKPECSLWALQLDLVVLHENQLKQGQ